MHIDSESKIIDRIVAVSKDPEIQKLAQKYSQEVFGADDPIDAFETIQTVNPNLILFDLRFNQKYLWDFIDKADNNFVDTPIVVVNGSDHHSEKEKLTELTEIGVYDFLNGRQEYDRLKEIINEINNKKELVRKDGDEQNISRYFINDLADSVCMVGQSNSVHNTLRLIKIVSSSRCNPILILGETGTGKELVAKAIHTLRHSNEKFVAVNCAALTSNLLESELFGHVKGSFTGADRDKTGLFELAETGTIFLDEISEMPMELQAKLLRVLEEKNFRKVGGTKSITCKATIVASSNRNLKSEVDENRFRRDLYYRLNICPIMILPLRSAERREDIPLLAEYFLKTSTINPEKRNKVTSLTKLAIEALQRHDWPGNIRELRNVIERAVMLEKTDKIGLNGIVFNPDEYMGTADETSGLKNDFSLEKAERKLISRALQETGWQKTRAATLLGITRATLYAKVKQYNIERNSNTVDNSVKAEVVSSTGK
jgi:DNA-binding NtrC family response regulator